MAVVTTNLGAVTAYGDAVAAGYTGTKAEWQALMASYATVAEEANDAKDDAVAAKNTAVSKATEATTAANTATTKASEASVSAQSIAQSAAQIQENTDDISQLKSDLNYGLTAPAGYVLRATDNGHGNEWAMVGTPTDAQAATAINAWLDDHPEATTTVEDGVITFDKLSAALLGEALTTPHMNASGNGLFWGRDYVTPEMFGAKGDGTMDDTAAFQAALNIGGTIMCNPSSNYLITTALRIKANTSIFLNGCTITCNQKRWLLNFLDTDEFTSYNGNGNIYISNGTVYGGSVSFWHGENITFEGVNFRNCNNDHFFELCANKNVTIKNCEFVGMKTQSFSATYEYINIDPCTTSQSTYFTGETFPSENYDGTRNENIYVLNNYFNINETDTTYQEQDNPFGCHFPLGQFHKNVQFIGNTCYNFKECAIRLSDFEKAIVRDNYFYSDIISGFAVLMTQDSSYTYSNKECILENNTFITKKWGINFQKTYNLICKGNIYENLDLGDHAFGTFGESNYGLVLIDNYKPKNKDRSLLSLDSGTYKGSGLYPFDLLQLTKAGPISISGNTVTLSKLYWTFFDEIYFQFTNSPTIFKAEGWAGYPFSAGSTYPIISDPTTGNALVSFSVSSSSPDQLTLSFASGVTQRTVQTIYVAKVKGTNTL